ncbi:glycosyltransferase family 4 protein [Pseudomonadales bacterium]|nr:glycosyltransferase family 4 protein [Pseudomonadales bacterium]MDB2543098.1 glycosyltransferase family 4 protein [Pseudomonadales bacterium]
MKIWIVTVGEPIPSDGEDIRLYRSGIMCQKLSNLGHEVTWLNSRFDHTRKILRTSKLDLTTPEGAKIVLLESPAYAKNVSVRRLWNHIQLLRSFNIYSKNAVAPNVILCSFPPVELSWAAVRYGKRNNIPVIVDVRDLWPDIFSDAVPSWLKPLAKLALTPLNLMTRSLFESATEITGVSNGYLAWGVEKSGRKQRENEKAVPLAYKSEKKLSVGNETAASLSALGVDSTKRIVLFIGSFGRTYDLSPVFKALKHWSDAERDSIQFVLAGDGELFSHWLSLSENENSTILPGWLNQSQISYLMSISEVGLAAYSENAPQSIPNKIIEYLSHGLPILSSLEGETAAMIKEFRVGQSYSASNPESFSLGLRKLIEDRSFDAATRCRTLYEKRFNADKVYDEFIEHIENLASPE